MEYTVIEKAGSDSSFDLIVEAITPCPPNGYELNLNDRSQADKSHEILKTLVQHFGIANKDWGLRVNLFERFPDGWIWQSRVESLIEKVNEQQKAA